MVDIESESQTPELIRHLREVFELRVKTAETALELQAKEYERRLDALNKEAERLREIQACYLPRDTCEVQYKNISDKIDYMQKPVYIGMGLILAFQFILTLAVIVVTKG